jgi:hypothetical protein
MGVFMKLSDNAYKKISQIIASETIYSPSDIYTGFKYINYDLKKLLKYINFAMRNNYIHISYVCINYKELKKKKINKSNKPASGYKLRIPPRPFFAESFKKKESMIKKAIKKAVEKFM